MFQIETSRNDTFSIDSKMASSGGITHLTATADTPIPQIEHLTFNGSLK